jgi:hypothetical protein
MDTDGRVRMDTDGVLLLGLSEFFLILFYRLEAGETRLPQSKMSSVSLRLKFVPADQFLDLLGFEQFPNFKIGIFLFQALMSATATKVRLDRSQLGCEFVPKLYPFATGL